jgi:hypothetical protein
MTELTIDRFTSTVQVPDGDGETSTRVRRLADRVAGTRLERAAARVALPPGDWCVRLVSVPLVLDLDRPATALEEEWARAVIDAIGAAIDQPTSDVVHYQRPADGLRDLIASTACRTTEHEWAWRQVGLLASGEASPATDPQAAVLSALRRFPQDALNTVVAALHDVGFSAMHRLLGSAGWAALTMTVCAAVGYKIPARPIRVGSSGETLTTQDGGEPVGSPSPKTDPRTLSTDFASSSAAGAIAAHLAEVAISRSALATAFMCAPIRPDPELSWNWAVLIAVESDSSILARANAADVIDSIAAHIDTRLAGAAHGVGLHTATSQPAVPARLPASADDRESVEAPDRTIVADTAGLSTVWAGLLFFLNTAADADIPRAILDDDALARRPLPHVLSALAMHIVPGAADDPAVLGFSGQLPCPGVFPALTDAEAERIAAHAERWIAATVTRIDDPDSEPEAVLRRIVSRRATIDAEPGWIDVQLDLADVDVDLRIAGLDVDPGWVPWLGTVVRFSYV